MEMRTAIRGFTGEVVQPGDPTFDTHREVWNGMVDRRPAIIARCTSAADVVAAVRYGREAGLEIAVKCGGHSMSGISVPEGGASFLDHQPALFALFNRYYGTLWSAVTLGGGLEARANALAQAGDYPEATLLGLIGDCAVAEAQARLERAAEQALAQEGLRRGVSLQPGAQYWPLEANRVFDELLPLQDLGIRVLESLALSPSKSKTFASAFARSGPGERP